MRRKRGGSLIEMLVVISVFLIIAIICFRMIASVLEKSKVISAKAHISQYALVLERVREDTGYYPVHFSVVLQENAPPQQEKGWTGPYTETIVLDPWKHPYFYQIPPTTLFSSPPIVRIGGIPQKQYFYIDYPYTEPVMLNVENYGVSSCDIYVNGALTVAEAEFKKNPQPQIINKTVTLTAGSNQLIVWPRGKPSEVLYISISGFLPTERYFMLGSYGGDGAPGGKGFNQDIVWYSNKYPNIQ